MKTPAFIVSIIGAVIACAGLVLGLASTGTHEITSRNGPTCVVRASEPAAPTAKATPFGGSGSMTVNTPAPPSPVCGS
jgi:hypothetical protein